MVIDIMVPYWGRVDWLEELVSSVKAQDCDHWRLVIIDDCYPGDAAKNSLTNATMIESHTYAMKKILAWQRTSNDA